MFAMMSILELAVFKKIIDLNVNKELDFAVVSFPIDSHS